MTVGAFNVQALGKKKSEDPAILRVIAKSIVHVRALIRVVICDYDVIAIQGTAAQRWPFV